MNWLIAYIVRGFRKLCCFFVHF